ncbi:hypothetical protein NECAME_19311, partial [Necator americanus]
LVPQVSRYWSLSNVVINCFVVFVHIFTIIFIYLRGKSNACLELRKVIRRLKVIMIVFVLSWFVSILGVDVGYVMHFTPATLSVWQSNM